MVNMPAYTAVLLVLLATRGSAFLQVGPLHDSYNKNFQRALFAKRRPAGTNSSPTGGYLLNLSPSSSSPAAVDTSKKQDNEKFQRALLEAKLAYDAIAAATATTAAPTAEVVDDVSADVALLSSPAAVIAVEPELESEPVLLVEPPTQFDYTVVDTTPELIDTTPEPEIQKPVIIASAAEKGVDVKQTTEFTVPRELAIVPINESTVQFTAGALGGVAGFLVGGPIVGIITASVFNYLSRKEEDKSSSASETTTTSPKKIVDTASQTALLAYNYVAQFEKKNKIVDSIFKFMERLTERKDARVNYPRRKKVVVRGVDSCQNFRY